MPRLASGLLALLPAGLFLGLLFQIPALLQGHVLRFSYPWLPDLGLAFSLQLDALSLLFALLISGIGTLVLIYAGSYLSGNRDLARFLLILLSFMGAMLGLVLADHFLWLFVCWELTSITSYLLIGFEHDKESAREAARQGFLVTAAGGLALLAGLLLLAQGAEVWRFSELLARQELLLASPLLPAAIVLIALGAFTKSAQFPFHFWLPNAMAAPTPVSAYLHSATMVKAGIYLLARLQPVLGAEVLWQVLLITAGTLTLLLGSLLAYQATALKKVLAYSTIMALGTLTLLLGLGTPLALKTFGVFLLGHALYKGALFMLAGNLTHQSGQKDLLQLGGLAPLMPWSAATAALAALSLAGLPPSLGFLGKELLFETLLLPLSQPLDWLVLGAVFLSAVLTTALALVLALKPFYGALPAALQASPPREAQPALLLGPGLLAIAGLGLGLWGHALSPLLAAVTSGLQAETVHFQLKLWHGFNLPLLCSGLALLGGLLAWVLWLPSRARAAGLQPLLSRSGPEAGYRFLLQAMNSFAAWQTRLLQNGKLGYYQLIIILTTVLLGSYTFLTQISLDQTFAQFSLVAVSFHQWALVGVMLLGAAYAVLTSSRLSAVASMGLLGFCIALLFMLFSAPDLGITQVLIETLMVILLVLVLSRLPGFIQKSTPLEYLRDGVVALSTGGLMSLLVLKVLSTPGLPPISDFYIANAYTQAQGRNIVNVILVDFRALDTLGEVFVLAMAALGVLAMLRLQAAAPAPGAVTHSDSPRMQARLKDPHHIPDSLILQMAATLLLPLQLLFSVFLLLRGHDAPGGGFIAGLIFGGALILYLLAYGVQATRRLLRGDPRSLMAGGLLLSLLSVLPGLLRGDPLLTAQWWTFSLFATEFKLSTVLIFDLGVYLVVPGMLLTVILSLMEEGQSWKV